jgi:acetyl/propionyl-CoA carboxylase alpha subunit
VTQNHGEMREMYPVAGEPYRYHATADGTDYTFAFESDPPEGLASSVTLSIESRETGEGLCRIESGRTLPFAWAWVGPELHLWLDGDLHIYQRAEPRRRGRAAAAEGSADILAPMPGAILEVLVAEGDRVERNQTVVLMESMKMELVISAPRDGIVRRVSVRPGEQVERGMRLLELAPEDNPES